ncbi:hypothetical protein AgCh_017388 [Apium graveolens]
MVSNPIPLPKLPQEDDPPNQTTSLLSFSTTSPHHPPSKPTFLLITTFLSLAAAIIFAFLFFSSSTSKSPHLLSSTTHFSTPLTKLKNPVVVLISSDGFRFGYQYKTPTPNINRLIENGTEATLGLIPVFPTLTFPNHYSIVTGLYPPYHGIINNFFLDPKTGDRFTMASHEPKWWLGEPLWETVVNHGLKAATYFWPGSEEPDHQGHKVGTDDPQITEAVARIDGLIGRLIDGLERRGVFQDVSIIMVGDHGMVGTCDHKLIFLEDLAPWIEIPKDWIQDYSPVLSIRPPPSNSAADVVKKMNEGLGSGKVNNGKYLKVYLKEELPSRLHYHANDRIPPIIGLIEEGFKVEQKGTKGKECGGAHGYDNAFFSMRTIFIGHGPRFAKGVKVPSFENIQIYNLVTSILNISAAPNNGTLSFPKTVLLPRH